jgi:hypothetical protein
MIPLWRVYSGKFAGCRIEDKMYDTRGQNIGYFEDTMLYALNGQCVGEVYRKKWIGKRVNVGYRYGKARKAADSVTCESHEDQEHPPRIEAWEDSIFFIKGMLGLQKRIWDN